MRFNDCPADRKPQACATSVVGSTTEEFIKQPELLTLRNPRSAITNVNLDGPVAGDYYYFNGRVRRRIFHRVFYQVDEDLFHKDFVNRHQGKMGSKSRLNLPP